MLKKLQQRWKVNSLDLVLIIATFAIGGSLCGWAGRKLLLLMGMEKGVTWLFLYIILVTLLWPVCVLMVSLPLGQFRFFRNYILKIYGKMSGKRSTRQQPPNHIAIFASGAGTNARRIIEHFQDPDKAAVATISLIVTNKREAGVVEVAREFNIPVLVIGKERFFHGDGYLPELEQRHINLIVLAGFLWKVPEGLVNAYSRKILNIHPALLPKHGGKGMYGNRVHEAVINNKERESGITIHYADALYDHGEIIYQATCKVTEGDNPSTLAENIHLLEHLHYPRVIEEVLQKQNQR